MSEVVAFHFQDLGNQERAGRTGMWIFISTEVLFFTVLFVTYGWMRTRYGEAFSKATEHSLLALGTLNTYVLLASSVLVALGLDAIRRDRPKTPIALMSCVWVLGAAFLAIKFTEYWMHVKEGILPGAAYRFEKAPSHGAMLFFTLYYVMTGLHAIHMLVGLGLVAWLIVRSLRGRYSAERHLGVELVGIYWHFVDIIWIFLWPLFYLMK